MSDMLLSPEAGLLLVVNFNQVHEIGNFLVAARVNFEQKHTIIIDDGSTDGSPEIAEKMGYRVIRLPRNQGVGSAIRTGLRFGREAGYRWVIISAANGKMRPDEFAGVYGPVAAGTADYVQGSRFRRADSSPGLPLFRRLMIPLFSLFASLLIGRRFSDITCGLRSYTFALLDDPSINLDQAWLNQYELEYYIHFKVARIRRYRMLEVPVTMQYAQLAKGRTSKIQPISGWWSMIRPFLLLASGMRK